MHQYSHAIHTSYPQLVVRGASYLGEKKIHRMPSQLNPSNL